MMKLYKRTIIVANIMTGVFFILSVICEFFEFAHKAIIQSYASGIVCSLIVVIVTTYLQFKYEQEKLLDSLSLALGTFFLHRYSAIEDLSSDNEYKDELWEHFLSEIEKSLMEISEKSREIRFFNRDIEIKAMKLSLRVNLIRSKSFRTGSQSKKKRLEKIVYDKDIDKVEKLALELMKDGFYKDNLIHWINSTKEIVEEIDQNNFNEVDT